MLEEKIPRQRAEHERAMLELQATFDAAEKAHATELAALERELKAATDEQITTKQMLDFYKNAYDVCVNAPHRSFKCWVWKVVSFGTGKCH